MTEAWFAPLISALAGFGLILLMLRSEAAVNRARPIEALSLIAVFLLLASAAMHRFAGVNHLLWASDEMVTLFAGIRLHLLPWWNLAADARENFFKSLVMPIHGLGDNVFFYAVVWGFRLLNVPVTEANLFSAGAALGVASLVLLFLFARRLFGMGAALVALALASWNQTLISFSFKGFQMNFVVFLQIASLYAYWLHLTKPSWPRSLLMAGLMALCAGSELFYFAPVFLGLHLATTAAVRQPGEGGCLGLLDRKNLAAWSGYGLMLLVNLALYAIVGHRLALTLFGQLAVKRRLGGSWFPHYGLNDFLYYFHQIFAEIPGAAYVSAACALWLLLNSRRSPYGMFFGLYLMGMTSLAYLMKFALAANMTHLLIPAMIVIGAACVQGLGWLTERVRRDRSWSQERSGLLCVALLIPLAAPWRVIPWDQPAEPYRCVKAVGYAIRELGQPTMDVRVMFLSDHVYIPPTMEYYTGLNASWDTDEPTRIFHLRQATPAYFPSQILRRNGLDQFDCYVDFVKERFPLKDKLWEDLKPMELHEVYRIGTEGDWSAVIYSPQHLPARTLSIEEGNRGFDRTYADWKKLFYSRNVGAFWYYDANY